MEATTASPPPEPQLGSAYCECLGRIVVEFQSLEELITFSLLRLTRPPVVDEVVDMPYVLALSELPFKARLKLLRNHLEKCKVEDFLYPGNQSPTERAALFEELLRRMRAACMRCENLEDRRNQLIHSVWRAHDSDPEGAARRFKLRVQAKRTAISNEEVPLSELKALSAEMKSTRESVSVCSELLGSVLFEKRANAA